jgi:hypothetical protein
MTLRYKVEGYAKTRDAISWIGFSAPELAYGLSISEAFAGLEHGYQSVLPSLKDEARRAQWQESYAKMQEAHRHFLAGDVRNGKLTLQQAGELFTMLRRIGGKKPSRQEIADTEHGANELDE